MKAHVVIGAGFGDEGKGKMVDFLASRTDNAVVVKCNGGAQAAHTVQVEGQRTIFHHIGSGHLAGADTYLEKEFIVNPILFNEEFNLLPKNGKIVCHPECRVTTPYDMIYNQALEMQRGDNKHGSCGLGINATVDRHEKIPFHAFALASTNEIRRILTYTKDLLRDKIKKEHINQEVLFEALRNSFIIDEKFIQDCHLFYERTQYSNERFLIGREIIFEMAQGLLLDEHHEWFPYVTRSRTGLDNVIAMLPKIPSITELRVTYMTRAYATRHGAGPFPTEHEWKCNLQDETNLFNKWQGFLRFGYLDLDLLFKTIEGDINKAKDKIPVTETLCVTCVDQVSNSGVLFKHHGTNHFLKAGDFLSHISDYWSGKIMFSMGAERWDMSTLKDAKKESIRG